MILDGTFLREDYRKEAVEKLSRHYSSAVVVSVVCPLETAKARNSSRNAVVPEESFNRLASSFERPRRAIVVDSGARTPESAAKYVLGRMGRGPRARRSAG